ncbi:MAG: AP2 domain-containing protein [Solirubrobacteraceae bacterium]
MGVREPDDYAEVVQYKWTAAIADRYALRWDEVDRRAILMHRHIMGCVKGDGLTVDHRNGDGFDNTRANLRLCTHAENCQNRGRRTGASSRFSGVTRSPNGKRWIAQVRFQGNQYYLGTFDDEEDAATVADAFRRKHFTHYHGRSQVA